MINQEEYKKAEANLAKQREAIDNLKNKLNKVLKSKTKYHVLDDTYDYNTFHIVRRGLTSLSDTMAFSAIADKNGINIKEVDLCLTDIIADGPAIYTDRKQDIDDLIQALSVIRDYLAK